MTVANTAPKSKAHKQLIMVVPTGPEVTPANAREWCRSQVFQKVAPGAIITDFAALILYDINGRVYAEVSFLETVG